MDKLTAKDIAKETEKVNKSFSQVMNLAIKLKEENDALNERLVYKTKRNSELKRQRDEALGQPDRFLLNLKNEAEANELKAEDLKPALILALGQRDVALRRVARSEHTSKNIGEEKDRLQVMVDSLKPDREQLKKIIYLLSCWDGGRMSNYITFIPTADGTGEPSDFDIIRHIIDQILTEKGGV